MQKINSTIFRTLNGDLTVFNKTLISTKDHLKALETVNATVYNKNGAFNLQGLLANSSQSVSTFTKLNNAFKAYNGNLSNSTQLQNAYVQAVGKQNTSLGNYLAGLNGAKASMGGYIKSLVAAKAASIGLQVASVALNTAISMGITLAINAFTKWVNKEKEAREKAIENAKAAREEANNLSELLNKYNQLSKEVKSNQGVKEDLLSVQSDLLEALGIEASQIDTLIEKYGDLDSAINQLTLDSLRDAQGDLMAAVDAYEKELINVGKGYAHWYSLTDRNMLSAGSDSVKLFDILEKAGIISSGSHGEGGGTLILTGDDKTVEGILENYQKLKEAQEALNTAIDNGEVTMEEMISNSLYKSINARLDELKKVVDNYDMGIDDINETMAQQQILKSLAEQSSIPETKEEFEAFQQSMIDTAIASTKFKGSQDDILDSIINVLSVMPEFEKYFEELNDVQSSTLNNETPLSFDDFLSSPTLTDTREKLIELSQSGIISEENISGLEGYNELLEQCGGNVDALIKKIQEYAETSGSTFGTINNLDTIQGGLNSLSAVYADKMDGDGFVQSDLLSGLYEQFGDLSFFDEFIDKMMDVNAITEESQDAFDDLATQFIDTKYNMADLTEENAKYVAEDLRKLGVKNAEEAVNQRLMAVEGQRKNILSLLNSNEQASALAQKFHIETSEDLARATSYELVELAKEMEAAGLNAASLRALALQKQGVNAATIDTTIDVEQLLEYANTVGLSTAMTEMLEEVKNNHIGSAAAAETILNNAKESIKAAVSDFDINYKYKYTGGAGGKNSGGGSNKNGDTSKTEIDWIARKLERLQKIIDTTKAKFDNLFTVKSKSSNLDKQIKQTKDLLKANEKAAKKYKSYADKVKLSKDSKKDKELKEKVRSGNYNIKEYDSDTANKINQYKELYDNYKEATKQVDELTTAIRELKEEKYQLYVDKAEANIDKLNAQKEIAIGYKEQNGYLDNQKKYIEQSYEYQIEIAKLTKDKVKQDQLEAELQKELRDLEKEKFENIKNYYENQINLLELSQQKIEDRINLLEAKGMIVNAKYYQGEIEYQKTIMKQSEEEYQNLQTQLTVMENAGLRGTDAWYKSVEALSKVESSITECKTSIAEMNNSIVEIGMSIQNKILDRIKGISGEMDWITNLMSQMELLSDSEYSSSFTHEGLATLGSYVSGYNTSKYASDFSKGLVDEMQKALDENRLEFTYNGQPFPYESRTQLEDAIVEANETWRDEITETYDYSNKIIDMMIDKLKKELSALQNLIDAKKDALQAEKDLHNYKKSIKESTDNIAALQKRLAAIQGDHSEEGAMRIQKLQKELADAKEDLEEKEYDRLISDQQSMLDKLMDEYTSLINAETKNRDKLLQKGIDAVILSKDTIAKTIGEYADKYNYTDPLNNLQSGLNIMTGNEGPLNQVKTYVSSMVEDVGLIPTAISGVTTVLSDISSKLQQILTGNPSNGTNNNIRELRNPANEEPLIKAVPTTTATTYFNTKAGTTTTYKNNKTGALKYIDDKAGKPAKSYNEYSAVNQKIWELTGGKILSSDELKELADIVGVNYNNGKATENGELYQRLKKLGVDGFKHGGIGKLVKENGEDGIAMVSNGEGFIAPENIKDIRRLLNTVPIMTDLSTDLINIPDLQTTKQQTTNNIEASYSFILEKCNNADDIIKQIQQSPKVQRALRDVTINNIAIGGSQNRLSVNRIN